MLHQAKDDDVRQTLSDHYNQSERIHRNIVDSSRGEVCEADTNLSAKLSKHSGTLRDSHGDNAYDEMLRECQPDPLPISLIVLTVKGKHQR